MTGDPCTGPNCDRPSKSGCGGLCDSHYRQARRGGPLRPLRPYRSAADTLYEAAVKYATAETAEEHDRATARLRAAARLYVESSGGSL